MTDAQAQQFISVLRMSKRIDLSTPGGVLKAKKVYAMARELLDNPKYGPLPQTLTSEIYQFLDGIGARPELGISSPRVGNKWEQMLPYMSPIFCKKI